MSNTDETGPEGQDNQGREAEDLRRMREELAELLAAGLVEWGDVGACWRPRVDRRRRPRRAG